MNIAGVFLPSVNNGLARRFPSQRFEVLGKIESAYEGEHMSVQALQVSVVKGLDGGLPVRLRVARLGQLVRDAVFIAHTAKDVHVQKGMDGLVTVFGQVCKNHPTVGESSVNPVGKGFDHTA